MFYLFITLIIIASVLLVFFVLIQNPKGGGLNSNFAGSNNLMGVKRTGDILEKGTWVLVVSIMVIALLINVTLPSNVSTGGSGLGDQINPTTIPTTPAPATTAPGQMTPVAPQNDTAQ